MESPRSNDIAARMLLIFLLLASVTVNATTDIIPSSNFITVCLAAFTAAYATQFLFDKNVATGRTHIVVVAIAAVVAMLKEQTRPLAVSLFILCSLLVLHYMAVSDYRNRGKSITALNRSISEYSKYILLGWGFHSLQITGLGLLEIIPGFKNNASLGPWIDGVAGAVVPDVSRGMFLMIMTIALAGPLGFALCLFLQYDSDGEAIQTDRDPTMWNVLAFAVGTQVPAWIYLACGNFEIIAVLLLCPATLLEVWIFRTWFLHSDEVEFKRQAGVNPVGPFYFWPYAALIVTIAWAACWGFTELGPGFLTWWIMGMFPLLLVIVFLGAFKWDVVQGFVKTRLYSWIFLCAIGTLNALVIAMLIVITLVIGTMAPWNKIEESLIGSLSLNAAAFSDYAMHFLPTYMLLGVYVLHRHRLSKWFVTHVERAFTMADAGWSMSMFMLLGLIDPLVYLAVGTPIDCYGLDDPLMFLVATIGVFTMITLNGALYSIAVRLGGGLGTPIEDDDDDSIMETLIES